MCSTKLVCAKAYAGICIQNYWISSVTLYQSAVCMQSKVMCEGIKGMRLQCVVDFT